MRFARLVAIVGCLWLFLALTSMAWVKAQEENTSNEVVLLTVKGPVTPAMGAYLQRGLQKAEEGQAQLLILRLDTPGGEVSVMRQLVQQLSNTTIPTLVYVWPGGAQAASAGTFITLSADLAAMALQTTIGAASAVGSEGQDLGETMSKKVNNDLAAFIRTQMEGRSEEAIDWAERAVTEAVAANAEEALELGIIDFIARDLDELLPQVDGTTVELADGQNVTLDLKQVRINELEMNLIEIFLHIITDPNIALLLISIGGAALTYEFASPGGYIGGMFGVIALTLGFYSVGSLDANWAGLALMAFGFVLFVVETQTPTYGLFTIGGLAAFIFGSLLLFQTSYRPVSLELIIVMALSIAGFMIFVLAAVFRSRYRPALTGSNRLVAQLGQARSALSPDGGGMVFLDGELWQATSDVPLEKGQRVRVVAVEGLHLQVEAVD